MVTENKNTNKPQRIDILNAADIKKWSVILNCNEQDVVYAVINVGSDPKRVSQFLELNRKKEFN